MKQLAAKSEKVKAKRTRRGGGKKLPRRLLKLPKQKKLLLRKLKQMLRNSILNLTDTKKAGRCQLFLYLQMSANKLHFYILRL
jgi:hypothetical protein